MKRRLLILSLLMLAVLAAAGWLWWQRDRAGREFYTDGARISQPVADAYVREILWQPPQNLPVPINSDSDEYEPRISLDGSTLLLVRGRAGSNSDIFSADRLPDGGWSEPQSLTDINTDHDELGPALSPDGRTLIFSSNRPSGSGGYDLWLATRSDFGWNQPVNLGPEINSEYHEYGPSLNPDGALLLFTSNRPASGEAPTRLPGDWSATVRERYTASDYDLYSALVKPDGFEKAIALAALNSEFNEGAPTFSPAGDFLYFCSDRDGGAGGFDLYRSRLLEGRQLAPESLGVEINTSANEMDPVPCEGGFALVFSTDRRVPTDAAARAANEGYDLWRAESREVFVRVGPRSPFNYAALWAWLSPLLLWLLLLLLALGLLALCWKGVRSHRLGLLARCVLASVIAHLMFMILLTFWQVTTTIAQMVERGSATRIVLAGQTGGGGLAGQLRGGVSGDLSVAPREVATANKADSIQMTPGAAADVVQLTAQRASAGAEEAARLEANAGESTDNRIETPRTDVASFTVAQQSADSQVQAPSDAQQITAGEARADSPQGGDAPRIARTANAPAPAAANAGRADVSPGAAPAAAVEPVRVATSANEAATANAARSSSSSNLPQSQEATQVDPLVAAALTLAQPREGESSRAAGGERSGPAGPAAAGAGANAQRAAGEVTGASSASGETGGAVALAPQSTSNGGGDAPAAVNVAMPGDSTAPAAANGGGAAVRTASAATDIGESGASQQSNVAVPSDVGAAGGAGNVAESGAVVTASNAAGGSAGRAQSGGSVSQPTLGEGAGAAVRTAVASNSGGGPVEEVGVGGANAARDSTGATSGGAAGTAAPSSSLALEGPLGGAASDGTDLAVPTESGGTIARGGATSQPGVEGPSSALTANTGRRDAATGEAVGSGAQPADGIVAMAPGTVTGAAGSDNDAAHIAAGDGVHDSTAQGTTSTAAPGSDRALGLDGDDALPALAAGNVSLPGDEAGANRGPTYPREASDRGPRINTGGSGSGRASNESPSLYAGTPGASSITLAPEADNGGGGDDDADASTTSVTGAVSDSDTISGSNAGPVAAALTELNLPEATPGNDLSIRLPTDVAPPTNPYAARNEETRLETVKRMGGSEETEKAVAMALEWLARHQSPDGRWATRAFDDQCNGCEGQGKFDTDIATTGLALLCFLGADHTHNKECRYQPNVERGLAWLLSQQEPDGDLRGGETMYSHGIASIAIAESLGMTGDQRLREPARLAVEFIDAARNRNVGGWRYEPRQAGDTSVAGWQVMALMSAKRAGLVTPDEAFAAASAWMEKVMSPNMPGRYAYQPNQPHSPSMTAEGMFIQQLLGVPRDDARMRGSVDEILANLPRWDESANTYYWYYATLAMFQYQSDEWEKWNSEITRVLLKNQRTSGQPSGSWDPQDNWSQIGGRVYQTAICTLCLEVYYRYLPMYRSPQLASARSAVRGVVTDASTGQPLQGAMVKLDMSIGSGVLIAVSDSEGRYALALPELPADFVALSASREGYTPMTVNISKAEAVEAQVERDFALEPHRASVIALEENPEVHHLGNNEFEGAINSQFQKQAEGTSYQGTFVLTGGHLPPRVRKAEVVLMVKGVQAQNAIFINGERLEERMSRAPRDGSFGEFRVQIPLEMLREGENTLGIRSSTSMGDLDDFEFVNVQIQFDAE